MTPRVRYFVSRVPEPETFHWFDLGLLPRDPVDLGIDVRLERLITHLPFPRCALVFVDADGRSTMLSLLEGTASVTVAGIVDIGGGQHAPIEPLAYVVSACPAPQASRTHTTGMNSRWRSWPSFKGFSAPWTLAATPAGNRQQRVVF